MNRDRKLNAQHLITGVDQLVTTPLKRDYAQSQAVRQPIQRGDLLSSVGRMPSLGARLTTSSLWLALNSAFTRALSLISQLVLAAILAKSDFGVYAAAVSISAFVTNLGDAGMGQWLTQGGARHFRERAGNAFWTAQAFNFVLGVLICGLAEPAGRLFGSNEIPALMLVTGASFPLITLGSYYRTILAIQLKMREVSVIEVGSALLRYTLVIGGALIGLGPISFVLPLPLIYLLEALIGYKITHDEVWRRRSNPRQWPALIMRNRWILAGTLTITLGLQIDYIIIGRFSTLSVLGVYFFAYQITFMTASAITENIRRVLFPGLVALPSEQRAAGVMRSARMCVALGGFLLMLLPAVISPLEELLWHGKWSDAIVPIQLMSLSVPLQILASVTQAGLQSDARFRAWTGVNVVRAVLIACAAGWSALYFPQSVVRISLAVTVAMSIGSIAQASVAVALQGTSLRIFFRRLSAPLLVGPAAVGIVVFAGTSLRLSLWMAVPVHAVAFVACWAFLSLIFDRNNICQLMRIIISAVRGPTASAARR